MAGHPEPIVAAQAAASGPPLPPAVPVESWESRMEAAARALIDIPSSRVELRRRLEEPLGFCARVETIQAIARVAELGDPSAEELCRRLFPVHVIAIETIRDFWNCLPLQKAIGRGIEEIEWLRDAVDQVDVESAAVQSEVSRDHTERLRELRVALIPPIELLQAAQVLIPPFERLVSAVTRGCLEEEFPELSPVERGLLKAATGLCSGPCPDRATVDGIVLRVWIERHLAEATEFTERLVARLIADKIAYRQVSKCLQTTCAELRQQGHTERFDLADRVQKSLFGTYLRMARVLNDGALEPNAGEQEQTATIREKIDAAERVAEEVRAENDLKEKVVQQAVERSSQPESEPATPAAEHDPAAERRRKRILFGIAGVMLVAAVANNVVFYRDRALPTLVSTEALSAVMPMSTVMPVGELMYTEVSGWLWDRMSDEERREKVAEIGRIAMQQGFPAVYISDEERRALATWSQSEGVRLIGFTRP
jgi:hypothetical protein